MKSKSLLIINFQAKYLKKKRDLQSDWHSLNKLHLTQYLISTCNNSHDIWFRLQSQLFISTVFRLTSEFD